jgi:hypothetical protein
MRRIAPLGLLLLAAACTTDPQHYVGQGGDRLYLAWGPPVATERLPRGEQRVVFLRDQCLTSFVLSDNGVVKSASNRGGGCPGR